MGSDTTTKSPLWGALHDAGRSIERVTSGSKKEGEGRGGDQTVNPTEGRKNAGSDVTGGEGTE